MDAQIQTLAANKPPITLGGPPFQFGGLGDWGTGSNDSDIYYPDPPAMNPVLPYVAPGPDWQDVAPPFMPPYGVKASPPSYQPATPTNNTYRIGPYVPPPVTAPSAGGGNLASILKAIETGLVAFAKPGNAYAASTALQAAPIASGGYQTYRNAAGQVVGADGQPIGLGAGAGAVAGGVFDSIGQLVKDHPLEVLLFGGGALLLFLKPPGRK